VPQQAFCIEEVFASIMDISGEYFIPTPRQRVWAALNDPDLVRTCIPGCKTLVRISPVAMRGTVEAKIGPLKATFSGTLTQSEVRAPESCRLTAEGDGATAGFAKGTADVTLTEAEGGTRLRYVAHANVGGKLAEVGARVIDTTAKQMADQFFGTFAARVGEGALARAEHAVEHAAHEVAEVARDEVEKAEVAAGRGVLGGPYVWSLLALAAIIALLLILR
jgi:carbon monoxide dehydrogenase subunit G